MNLGQGGGARRRSQHLPPGGAIGQAMPGGKKPSSALSLQRPSVTGLAAYGAEQEAHHLMATDSTSNQISFFDLRMIMDQVDSRHYQSGNAKSNRNHAEANFTKSASSGTIRN